MIRPATLFLLMLVLSIGFGLFKLKYEVQSLEEDFVRINRQIVADQEAMHVLKAEWSYLNQPARLDQMAKRHLSALVPVTPTQLGSIDGLPMKAEPAARPAPAAPAIAGKPAAGTTVAANTPSPRPPAAAIRPVAAKLPTVNTLTLPAQAPTALADAKAR